jgi:tripartite-type tricarboxylate transporter receptor subunit TctC
MNAPAVTELLAADGSRPLIESPPAFAAFLKNEMTKWTRVVRQAGITAG